MSGQSYGSQGLGLSNENSQASSGREYPQDANGNILEESMFHRPKKLVVCCDGTWMNSDNGWVKDGFFDAGYLQVPSNITRLARSIKAEDSQGHPQIVYYQAGIGTGIGLWDHIVGGGVGVGFSENIREAYAFLANNYAPNDAIFLTGFSRGAYTARSLGGLIAQMGLLYKHGMQWFYDIFTDWQRAGDATYEPRFLKNFKDQLDNRQKFPSLELKSSSKDPCPKAINIYLDEYRCKLLDLGLTREVSISAIGVFDTVGALGIPLTPFLQKIGLPTFLHGYKWTDTTLDNHVKHAFQAIALDERRSPFYPCVWERPAGCTTNLKQVWFAGVHTSIGGGATDEAPPNISLAWMMDQLSGDSIRQANPDKWHVHEWLEFDPNYLNEQNRRNVQFHERLRTNRTWSTGIIVNSLTGITAITGQKVRTPGRTRPFKHDGDFVDDTRLLQNTNEMLHASVRSRIDLRGPYFEPEPPVDAKPTYSLLSMLSRSLKGLFDAKHSLYLPQARGEPLEGWILRDGHQSQQAGSNNTIEDDMPEPPVWVWTGQDPLLPDGSVLKEEVLGSHERALLDMYPEYASAIEGTNVGSEGIAVLAKGSNENRVKVTESPASI